MLIQFIIRKLKYRNYEVYKEETYTISHWTIAQPRRSVSADGNE